LCRNLTLKECEDEIHTPKMGTWESFETPISSKLDCKGQNTLHWGVLYIIGKLSKCKCRKWPCLSHVDIYNTRYGQKKGQESNWQFDSWPLKVGNQPTSMRASGMGHTVGKLSMRTTTLLQTLSRFEVWAKHYSLAKLQESKPW
jgi:hypothetical protein